MGGDKLHTFFNDGTIIIPFENVSHVVTLDYKDVQVHFNYNNKDLRIKEDSAVKFLKEYTEYLIKADRWLT